MPLNWIAVTRPSGEASFLKRKKFFVQLANKSSWVHTLSLVADYENPRVSSKRW